MIDVKCKQIKGKYVKLFDGLFLCDYEWDFQRKMFLKELRRCQCGKITGKKRYENGNIYKNQK